MLWAPTAHRLPRLMDLDSEAKLKVKIKVKVKEEEEKENRRKERKREGGGEESVKEVNLCGSLKQINTYIVGSLFSAQSTVAGVME